MEFREEKTKKGMCPFGAVPRRAKDERERARERERRRRGDGLNGSRCGERDEGLEVILIIRRGNREFLGQKHKFNRANLLNLKKKCESENDDNSMERSY